MEKILNQIESEVAKAFEEKGYAPSYGKVTLSNRPDLCEYQCNGALAAAKAYKKAPIIIAEEVVDQLKDSPVFREVQAVKPGFINLKISDSFLVDYLTGMRQEEKFGCQETGQGRTIVMDYGGPNVAKPLHVGHLRSAIIGESIKRLGRFMGWKVIGDAHLGDWGLQMGLIIEELRERKPDLPYFDESFQGEYPKEPPFTLAELEEIYPTASAKAKKDEDFAKRAHDATYMLQHNRRGYRALWQHIMNLSLPDLERNYANLDVTFDVWKKESDAQPYIPDMIQMFKDKGFAYESQGALVVDVKEDTDTKEIPPCIIVKSDGATLYATTDLATLVEREKLFAPDEVIYIVDKRQELHFTQVFRCAKKTGIVRPETKLTFIGFGTMNGKDGKPFKTREGGVMRLERLIAEISDAVYQKIQENRSDVSQEEARETAKIVGLSALKYGDLSNQASKDYVFDMERFTSFEGNTGPYILYTIVRIKSILAKYEELNDGTKQEILPPASDSERALCLELTKLSEALFLAFEEKAPHRICQYIYDLANEFNHFYHETKIIAQEDRVRRAGYIALITLTKDVLSTCIHLLGFEAPDRM